MLAVRNGTTSRVGVICHGNAGLADGGGGRSRLPLHAAQRPPLALMVTKQRRQSVCHSLLDLKVVQIRGGMSKGAFTDCEEALRPSLQTEGWIANTAIISESPT